MILGKILPESEERSNPVKSPLRDEGSSLPVPDQSPPPYNLLSQGASSARPPPNLPPDLAPTNFLHVKEEHGSINRKILLDLSVPRPPANARLVETQGEDNSHLILDSQNGSINVEVWVLSPNREDIASHGDRNPARERVHLHFGSRNRSIKAQVHIHPQTVEPRPFLSIELRACNSSIRVTIPRTFRGQLTLHTDKGGAHFSSTLAPRVASLSSLNGTHTYFVGERPSCGKWHTGESEDGDEVDGLIASTTDGYGPIKVSYDEEDVNHTKGPGIFSSLFKAIGF